MLLTAVTVGCRSFKDMVPDNYRKRSPSFGSYQWKLLRSSTSVPVPVLSSFPLRPPSSECRPQMAHCKPISADEPNWQMAAVLYLSIALAVSR